MKASDCALAPFPLSFGQEAMWLIDRLQSGHSIQYNIAYAIHFNGIVNKRILEKSLNHVLERHEVLRSVFQKGETHVNQLPIEQSVQLESEFIFLADFSFIALMEARTPFNLAAAPALRIRLLQTNDTLQNILLVNHHHIIHDGYSICIFIDELKTCYEAFLEDRTPCLPLVTVQYGEFARIQKEHFDRLYSESLAYWCDKLDGYQPLILPFRKRNGKMTPTVGDSYHFSIENRLASALKNICSQNDCSLFTGLLSILTLQFHQYCKCNDIALGTVMSTRTYQDDEYTMGMFVNTVILRNSISSSDTFLTILKKVNRTLQDAVTHRFTTLDSITRAIKVDRVLDDYTLFDAFVGYHRINKTLTRINSASFDGEVKFIDNKTAKFGISIDIYDDGESLDGKIEYCTELYDDDSIKKLAHEFITMIEETI